MSSKSKKQRKFFGAAMGAKKHQKGVKGAAKKVAKDMPEKEIKKFLKKESYEAGEMFDELFETFMSQFYVTEATRASYAACKDEDEEDCGCDEDEEEMADKDYDGDGEVESKKDEYFGSKDKAIKKAKHKQKQ
jgi:hypothetical protein